MRRASLGKPAAVLLLVQENLSCTVAFLSMRKLLHFRAATSMPPQGSNKDLCREYYRFRKSATYFINVTRVDARFTSEDHELRRQYVCFQSVPCAQRDTQWFRYFCATTGSSHTTSTFSEFERSAARLKLKDPTSV